MSKKSNNNLLKDLRINDFTNSTKLIVTTRKASLEPAESSWEDIQDNVHLIEKTNADGTKKNITSQKKPQNIPLENRPGVEYPEIIWYLISKYIKPEDVGTFARINKATYCVTKKKAFWMLFYKRYCECNCRLPERLQRDSFKCYGLRQTVIRALFYTYDVFVQRIARMATQDSQPHLLVNRKCVNVWFCKGLTYWLVYFKLKKPQLERLEVGSDFIEELGRIDANPEQDTKVLQVTCKSFQDVPPLMGMTLSSVIMTLAPGFRHHRLTLGFNSSPYTAKGVIPECTVMLDAVVAALVCDWWHPSYPHGGVVYPRQDPPFLKRNFFENDCS